MINIFVLYAFVVQNPPALDTKAMKRTWKFNLLPLWLPASRMCVCLVPFLADQPNPLFYENVYAFAQYNVKLRNAWFAMALEGQNEKEIRRRERGEAYAFDFWKAEVLC